MPSILRVNNPTVLLCAALGVGGDVQAQLPGPHDVSGQWSGVFHRYPYIVHLQLTVTASSAPLPATAPTVGEVPAGQGRGAADQGRRRAAAMGVPPASPSAIPANAALGSGATPPNARVRMEPLVDLNTIGQVPMGEFEATVTYDPTTGVLAVTPAPDAARLLRFQVHPFIGVLDRSSGRVGGVIVGGPTDSSPYFVLARPDDFNDHIRDVAREAMENTTKNPPRGGGPLGMFGGGGVDKNDLLAWASRFNEEYPDVDAWRAQGGPRELMTRNLFEDGHFRRYFGKVYEELSLRDLGSIGGTIRDIPVPRANFSEERPAGTVHAVSNSISATRGVYAAPDITVSVLGMRPIRAWMGQVRAGLEGAGTEVADMEQLDALEGAGGQVLVHFWPSERTAFARAFAEARSTLAEPALRGRIAELVASAEGIADARALHEGLAPGGSLARLMSMVAPEVREEQAAIARGRITEIVLAETTADRTALAAMRADANGLAAGAAWYAEASRKYGAFTQQPSVADLWTALAEQRAASFPQARNQILPRIENAPTAVAVNAVVAEYLSVPTDRADPVGSDLIRAAGARSGALQAAADAQAQERAEAERIANSPCSSAADPPGGPEGQPTAREMCFAIEETFTAYEETLDRAADQCQGDLQGDPMRAMLCLMGQGGQIGGGPQLYIRGFRKIGCVQPLERTGFLCEYLIDLGTNNQMLRSTVDFAGAGSNILRFVRMDDGWMVMRN